MYVYKQSERDPPLYTVGFHAPDGEWHAESDHSTRDEAAFRVNYLNGGSHSLYDVIERLAASINDAAATRALTASR